MKITRFSFFRPREPELLNRALESTLRAPSTDSFQKLGKSQVERLKKADYSAELGFFCKMSVQESLKNTGIKQTLTKNQSYGGTTYKFPEFPVINFK